MPVQASADDLRERIPILLQSHRIEKLHQKRASMVTRRHLIRSIGGLSALGVSTAAYGVGVEPMLTTGHGKPASRSLCAARTAPARSCSETASRASWSS